MTISKTMATFMSLLLTTGSAQGALRFGLGNAVAKGSADLITTASITIL